MEDVAFALKNLGCNVKLIPLGRHGGEFLRHAKKIRPDFIIALDCTGLDFPWIKKLSCLKVGWFVDNPFYFIDHINKESLLFCWDKDYIQELKEAGFQKVFPLPLATNPHIFNPHPLAPAEVERYSCDVSFVGSIGKSQSHIYEERKRLLKDMLLKDICNDEIHRLFDSLIKRKKERLIRGESRSFRDILGSQYEMIDTSTRLLIDWQSDYETGSLLREEVVSVLRSFRCLLFGSDELARMVSETCRFLGKIDYHRELPKLFKACLVNINVTRPQLLSTVNQRIYDVSATRSFLLTDYRRFLKKIFPFDINAICFRSLKELKDKIQYYLRHTKEREHLAEEMFSFLCMSQIILYFIL